MSNPISFLSDTVPALFAKGMVELEKLAASDPSWKKRYDDTMAGQGAIHVTFEGAGGSELWVAVKDGKVTAHTSAPTHVPTRMAVTTSFAAAEGGLQHALGLGLEGQETPERLAKLTRSVSGRVDKLIEKEKISFQLVINDVPEIETVVVKGAIGLADVPEKPAISATVSYDDIEDMRAGEMTPQQLFMKKVKIVGDASRLMTLVMTASQPIR